MISTYEDYKKARAEYSKGDKTTVYNEILGYKPAWFMKFYIDNDAIVEKDGAWFVCSNQPVGVVYSNYRGEHKEKRRVYGTIEEIRQELAGDRDSKIEYCPITYINFSKWEKLFRYGKDKIEQFDRSAIDSLADSKSADEPSMLGNVSRDD